MDFELFWNRRAVIRMRWKKINNEQDIQEIQKLYNNFMDAEIVSFRFDSGNYVDDNMVGHEYMENDFFIIFQRMDILPFSIEVHFIEMRRINFYAPLCNERSSCIDFAQFVKRDEYIYWTKQRNVQESELRFDMTFVEAKEAEWRILS